MLEVEAVQRLLLQLGVAEPIPLLEDEELHHHRLVGVGSSSSRGVVAVHGFDYWSEGFPVDGLVDLGESVAFSFDFFVGLAEDV